MSSFVLPMWAAIALALLAAIGVVALLAQRSTLRDERDENRRLKDQVSAMLQPSAKWPGLRRMAMSSSSNDPAQAAPWSRRLSNWFLVALVLLIVAYATALLLTLLLR